MNYRWVRRDRAALCSAIIACATMQAYPAQAQTDLGYHPIDPTDAGKTVTLTGHDLTIDQVIEVARGGAQVQLSAEAKQRESDNYGLLLEAPAEGVSVYWFPRGAGAGREVRLYEGDPLSPDNKAMLEKKMLANFRRGAANPLEGPEIVDEALVRAVMVVRANAMTFNAPSPPLAKMLIDLLNKRVTPGMQSRGTDGEGDLSVLNNIGATMVGAGDAYYQGTRMPASDALKAAALDAAPTFRRRRQRAHQQQCLCHRAGRVRRGRCETGAGVGGPHLRDRFECHEQFRHAAQLSRTERPAFQMAELGRQPRQGNDQGQLSFRR